MLAQHDLRRGMVDGDGRDDWVCRVCVRDPIYDKRLGVEQLCTGS
eukprot:COSAG02_NODE_60931_length_270_cov_0.578947_1_plen_45_part_01